MSCLKKRLSKHAIVSVHIRISFYTGQEKSLVKSGESLVEIKCYLLISIFLFQLLECIFSCRQALT